MKFTTTDYTHLDEDGEPCGTEKIKVPICHFTPMKPESYPYDDNWGEAAWGTLYRCEHCSCQILEIDGQCEKLEKHEKE